MHSYVKSKAITLLIFLSLENRLIFYFAFSLFTEKLVKKMLVEGYFYIEAIDIFNFRSILLKAKISSKVSVLEFLVSNSSGDQLYLNILIKNKLRPSR